LDEEEDYGDELQDEMMDKLFQEADDMKILEQMNKSSDQYTEALRKIEVELKNKP